MTADEIRKRKEQLDAAAPFAELAEAAAAMKSYADAVATESAIVAECTLGEKQQSVRDKNGFHLRYEPMPPNGAGLHRSIVESHAALMRRLNEAVDRVMRTALMDGHGAGGMEPDS